MIDYEVRDGKQVWPTCPDCGCRLYQPFEYKGAWMHYQSEQFWENGYLHLTDRQSHRCRSVYQMAGIYNGNIMFTGSGPFVIAQLNKT